MVEQIVYHEFEGVACYGENEKQDANKEMKGNCLFYQNLHYNGLVIDRG